MFLLFVVEKPRQVQDQTEDTCVKSKAGNDVISFVRNYVCERALEGKAAKCSLSVFFPCPPSALEGSFCSAHAILVYPSACAAVTRD